MSAPFASAAASLTLSQHEFAALGRLLGAEPLLVDWIPPLSVGGWMAVVDGLWARGVLTSNDGGASYVPSEGAAPLLAAVAGARQVRSAIVTSAGTTRGRLVIGHDESLVEFEVPGDGLSMLRAVSAEEADARLLEPLGLDAAIDEAVVGEKPAAITTTLPYDVVMAALERVVTGGAVQFEAAPGLAQAIASPRAHCKFDARTLESRGRVTANGLAWVDGADHGNWLLSRRPDGLAVRRVSLTELRAAAEALLAQ